MTRTRDVPYLRVLEAYLVFPVDDSIVTGRRLRLPFVVYAVGISLWTCLGICAVGGLAPLFSPHSVLEAWGILATVALYGTLACCIAFLCLCLCGLFLQKTLTANISGSVVVERSLFGVALSRREAKVMKWKLTKYPREWTDMLRPRGKRISNRDALWVRFDPDSRRDVVLVSHPMASGPVFSELVEGWAETPGKSEEQRSG